MNILLVAINSKFIHSNPAIYSLAAYAALKKESLKEHIGIAEYTINQQTSQVLSDLYFKKPDVLAISCYIWNIAFVEALLLELPKLLPGTKIWLGGPEVSYGAKEILEKYPCLSGIMVGEGEETFYELASFYVASSFCNNILADDDQIQKPSFSSSMDKALPAEMQDNSAENDETKSQLEKIPGLILQGGVQTPPRSLTNLSEIPFLYEDMEPFTNRIIYYETSRGCPFRCSYCLSSIDKTVRLRDEEIVKRELSFFLDKKVKQVKFVDRTFNCNKKHTREIWQYLLAHDNGVTNFHFEIEADLLDEEELSLLSRFRPGAVQLEIGVQTTNETTLQEIDRFMRIDTLKKVVSTIQKGRNVHLHLDLIAGLPYEDYESFSRSFDEVYAMNPDQLQLGFLKVLKGSKMHEKAAEYGISYLSSAPYEVLYTKWLPYDKVHQLKKIEEMVEIYYNSNQYMMTLPLLLPCFGRAFTFYEALADFYEKKGYFIQSPARSYRYQVLLEFAEEHEDLIRRYYFSREEAIAEASIAKAGIVEASIAKAGIVEAGTIEGNKSDVADSDSKMNHANILEMNHVNILDLVAESLTVDLYLRENCKTRPAFARDESLWKEEGRAFYQREAKEHTYLGGQMNGEADGNLRNQVYANADARTLARMTHIERVTFDLATGARLEKPVYYLLDYENRDAIFGQAHMQEIEL